MTEPTGKPAGLYGKFHVYRVDGKDQAGGTKENALYFVLDYVHDPHAMVALAAYADSCEADYPGLAADLREALGCCGPQSTEER